MAHQLEVRQTSRKILICHDRRSVSRQRCLEPSWVLWPLERMDRQVCHPLDLSRHRFWKGWTSTRLDRCPFPSADSHTVSVAYGYFHLCFCVSFASVVLVCGRYWQYQSVLLEEAALKPSSIADVACTDTLRQPIAASRSYRAAQWQ
jgi:hypothetical protein